jgi:glycosyltransferase involved in cell wall biosynthesis
LPSRYEGFGIAIVEAMMAKIPVIASNLDGPREILEGGYGYLFDVGNDKKLANLLEQIISGKIENNLVENAYMHAIDLFSIDRMILCMRNAYCQ